MKTADMDAMVLKKMLCCPCHALAMMFLFMHIAWHEHRKVQSKYVQSKKKQASFFSKTISKTVSMLYTTDVNNAVEKKYVNLTIEQNLKGSINRKVYCEVVCI